jgi:hypothetical protein
MKRIRDWLREKVLHDYWNTMDAILSKKNHSKHIWIVNGHYYEVVRRYKARKFPRES